MAKGKASSDERTLLGEYARALAAVGEAPPSKRSEALHKLDLNTMGFLDLSRNANSVMDKAIDNSDDSAIAEFAEAFKATRERLRAELGGKPADELATEPSPPPAAEPPPRPAPEPSPRPAPEPPRFAVAEGPQAPAVVPEARPLPAAPPPVERPKPPEPAPRQPKLGRGTVRMTYDRSRLAQPPAPPPVAPPIAPPMAPHGAAMAPHGAAPIPPGAAMAPPGAAPVPPPRVAPQPPPVVPVRAPSSTRLAPQSVPQSVQVPPQSDPSPPALGPARGGDTIMRPGLAPMDPDGLPAPVHFQQPRLALMQYAALRAEILSSPENMRGAVYARYHLTEPDDAAESAAWNARFSADRPLFAQYMQLFSYFRGLAKR